MLRDCSFPHIVVCFRYPLMLQLCLFARLLARCCFDVPADFLLDRYGLLVLLLAFICQLVAALLAFVWTHLRSIKFLLCFEVRGWISGQVWSFLYSNSSVAIWECVRPKWAQ